MDPTEKELMKAELADAEARGLNVFAADGPGSRVFFATPPHLVKLPQK